MPGSPADVGFGHGALFVLLYDDQTYVARVDLKANKVDWKVGVPHGEAPVPFLKVTAGAVWVRSGAYPGALTGLNPNTGAMIAQFSIDGGAFAITKDAVFDAWITNNTLSAHRMVRRLDRNTGKELSRYPLHAHDVVVQGGSLLAAVCDEDTVVRVNLETGAVLERTPTGDCPTALLVAQQKLWVLHLNDETLWSLPIA